MQRRPDPPVSSRHPRQRGEQSRERIKDALVDRRTRGDAAPTLDELVTATGLKKTAVRYHVAWLRQAGIVRFDMRREIMLVEEPRP